MKFITCTIIVTSVLIFPVIIPNSIFAQGVHTPAWKVGDRWTWKSNSTQVIWGTSNSIMFSNQTTFYNVTGEDTISLNGTDYDVFVIKYTQFGGSQTHTDTYSSFTNSTYNYTFNIVRSNYSTAKYIYYYNSSTESYYKAGGYHITLVWMLGIGEYYPPFDGMHYPVDVNKTWNASALIHSTGYTKSQVDANPPATTPFDTWTRISSGYYCDLVESVNVPAGDFDCVRLNQTYFATGSVTYTFTYVSDGTGNTVKVTSDQYGSNSGVSWESHSLQVLVDYSYTPPPPVKEYAILLLPIAGVIIIYALYRKTTR